MTAEKEYALALRLKATGDGHMRTSKGSQRLLWGRLKGGTRSRRPQAVAASAENDTYTMTWASRELWATFHIKGYIT